MAFDGIFLHQIVKQLQPMVGARISKIYQISDTEILFISKHYQLMVSAHSSFNRIHLTNRTYPTRNIPSNFIMLMRKYLEGGFITGINQVGLDRYLVIDVSSRNELGDRITLQLYVELMGKYANLILVNDNRIIDALKHIPPFENTIRTIQPGAQFKPTEPQLGKIDPNTIETVDNDENLFEKLTGFSPLLSDEVSFRLRNGQKFKDIMKEINDSDSLYIVEKDNQQYFHCLELTHLSDKCDKHEICEGLDFIYYTKEERERIRQITGDLFKFTRKEINKYTKKVATLNDQLAQATDCDKYRNYGEVIFGNLDKLEKGMNSIKLEDYEGNMITIPLDPKLDGKGNAKKHFTKYRKLSTGQKYILEQLEIAEDNLNYFNGIAQLLEIADFNSASEIKTELQNNGFLKAKSVKYRSKKPTEPNYSKIIFDDKLIMVGKNNIQNDYISFKKAGRFDYWFHIKNMTGAHVIINTDNPTEQQIRFCAMLAAYYSKARNSSSIPVDYTMVKNLKKIPDSKLGKVIMKEYKTIYIDIDMDLINQYIETK